MGALVGALSVGGSLSVGGLSLSLGGALIGAKGSDPDRSGGTPSGSCLVRHSVQKPSASACEFRLLAWDVAEAADAIDDANERRESDDAAERPPTEPPPTDRAERAL